MSGLMEGQLTARDVFSGPATVSHIQGEDKWLRLWIQPNSSNLLVVKKLLLDFAPKLDAGRGFLHQCQVPLQSRVIIRSTHDNQWHRGAVLNWLPGSTCDVGVQLIDSGRLEYVDVNLVRKMDDPQYQSLDGFPPCATECWLADAWPANGAWSSDAVQMAIHFVKSSNPVKVLAVGHAEGQPMVHIFNEQNGLSLGNFLIQQGFAETRLRQPSPPFQHPQANHMLMRQMPVMSQHLQQPIINQVVQQQPCYSCLSLEMGAMYRVVISHVEGPHYFFIQLVCRDSDKCTLSLNISTHIESGSRNYLQSLRSCTPCLAYLTRDKVYARALVLHANGDGQTFTVHFVDIGCSEKKPYTELLAIPPDLMIPHVLAYECQLSATLPEPTLMPQIVAGKVFDCQLLSKNGNRLVVNLSHNGRDITELCRPQPILSRATPVGVVHAMSVHHSTAFRYRPITLSKGFRLQVLITYVQSPSEFYGQILDNSKQIDEQLNAINEFYISDAASSLEVPIHHCLPGFPVAAPYSLDGNWYRAEIKQTPFDGNVEVIFVDYGNSQWLPVKALRQLHTSLEELPKQAIHFSLSGLDPAKVTPKMVNIFKKHVEEQELVVEVKECHGSSYAVLLYSVSSGQPMNQLFVDVSSKATVSPPALEPTESVFITVFNSAEDFFGQLTKFSEDEFSTFTDELDGFYNSASAPGSSSSHQVGDMVVCRFKENNTFYRAKILGLSNHQADIFYIDYGNRETVHERELFPLEPQFAKLCQQGIHCGFSAENMKKMPKEKLESLLSEATIEVTILSSVNMKHQVELTKSPANASILKAVEESSGPGKYPIPKLNIGSKYEVMAVDVLLNGQIICQLQDNLSVLESTMGEVDAFYKTLGQDHLRSSVPGTPCVANYSEDGCWYRAEVKSVQENTGMTTVYFVDYGNTEVVPSSEVKALNADFAQLPKQTIFCKLQDSSVSWTDQSIEKFKEAYSEQALTAHIKGEGGLNIFMVDLYDSEENRISDKLFKSQSKPAAFQPASKSNFSASDDWDEGTSTTTTNQPFKSQSKPSFQPAPKNSFPADDDWDEGITSTKSNSNDRGGSRDNNRDKGRFLYRDDADNDAVDKPRGRFGGRDSSNERPKRNQSSDSSDWPSKGGGNWKNQNRDNFDRRNDSNSGNKFGDREKKPWEKKDDFKSGFQRSERSFNNDKSWEKKDSFSDGYQNRGDSGFRNENSQSFGPKSKLNSPVKAKPEVKAFGSFLDVKPMSCADVFVVHVVNPGEFYCHLAENSPKVMALLESMDECYSKMGESQFTLFDKSKNAVCCAQSSEDSAWYRARVQEVVGQEVEVLFVDYGNGERVPENKVKELKQEFHSLPIQALKCSLMNVQPEEKDWDPKDVEIFRERVIGENVLVRFRKTLGEGSYQVQVVESTELERIMQGLAHTKLESVNDPLSHRNLSSAIQLQYADIQSGTVETVDISWVQQPHIVRCQVKSKTSVFKDMMEKMQNFYNELPDSVGLVKPVVGMYCVAQFTEDNAWYRCQVKQVKGGKVEVYYVDYGNCEEVTRHCMRCLASDFSSVPCHALKCKLKGINTLREVDDQEVERLYSGEFSCSFLDKEEDLIVVKLVSASGKDLAAGLVGAGICEYGGAEKAENFSARKIPSGSVSVYVSHVNNLESIFVQLTEEEEALNAVTTQLESLSPESPALKKPAVGTACCAKFSEDESYYRATIVRLEGEEAEVLFVDFGNTDVVQPSTLLEVPENLLCQPPYALKCSLAGITSNESQETQSLELFNSLTQDVALTAVLSPRGRSGASYSIVISDEDSDLKQRLLDSGFTMEIEETKEELKYQPAVVPSEPEVCYVSHVTSIQEFYLQLVSQEDVLIELAARVDDICKNGDVPNLADPVVGSACCALFSEDGNWYRAEIVSLEGVDATVHFVDYGNSDVVDANTLKEAQEVSTPPFALKCCLSGVPLISGQEQQASDMFNSLTEDKTITATISGTQVPLQVSLRTEEDGDLAEKLLASGLAQGQEEVIEQKSELEFKPPVLPAEPEACYVSHAVSIQHFYLNLSSQETQLSEMAAQLDMDCSAAEAEQLINPQVGAACCAQFSEDGSWYRAVIEVLEGEQATVRFVDYGNCDTVDVNTLKTAKNQMSHPVFAFKCRLGKLVSTPGNEQEATDLFKSLTDEQNLTATFSGTVNSIQVNLMSEEAGDIVEKLLDSGFVSVQEEEASLPELSDFPTPVLPVEPEVCYCTSVSSFDDIFLQLSSQESTLAELSERLNEVYAEGGEQLSDPVIGAPCSACFSEDESWYRARIISIKDTQAVVRFVDFGNTSPVDVLSLKALTPEFLTTPPFALNCRLGKLLPVAGKEEEAVVLLQSLITEKELACTFGGTASAITVVMSTEDDGDIATKLLESECVFEKVVEEGQELADTGCVGSEVAGVDLICEPVSKDSSGMEDAVDILESESQADIVEEIVLENLQAVQADGTADRFENGIQADVVQESVLENQQADGAADKLESECEADIVKEYVLENQQAVQADGDNRLGLKDLLSGPHSCFVTHVSSITNFYLQLATEEPALSKLSERLNNVFTEDSKEQLENPSVGMLCTAQYTVDGSWYRSKITSIDENNATVFFIDYGNSDVVEVSSLKPEVKENVDVPAFAWECSLGCYVPVAEKQEEANELFLSLTQDIELTAVFTSTDERLSVTLSSETECDLAQRLLDSGLIVKGKLEESETIKVKGSPDVRTSLPPLVIPMDEETCFVSNAGQGPTKFFLQLSSQEDALSRLNAQLSQVYSLPVQVLSNTTVGSVCCTQYALDEAWYRAQILSVEDEEVKVLFVDYGNTETVSSGVLHPLLPDFTQAPPFAYECCLVGLNVVPGEEESVLRHFNDLTQDKELTVTFHGQTTGHEISRVKLSDQDGDLTNRFLDLGLVPVLDSPQDTSEAPGGAKQNSSLSSESLVSEDLLEGIETLRIEDEDDAVKEICEVSLNSKTEKPLIFKEPEPLESVESVLEGQKFTIAEETEAEIKHKFFPVPFPEGHRCRVRVSHVISPQQFWVQLCDNTISLEYLTQGIFESLDGTDSEECFKPAVGDLCAAHFSDDLNWYRCRVDKVEEKNASLFFVDYGNSEVQDYHSIRMLKSDLWNVPYYAVECRLSGCGPIDWSKSRNKELCDQFCHLVLGEGKQLTADFLSLDNVNGIASVKLLDMGLNVADELIKKFVAGLSLESMQNGVEIPEGNSSQSRFDFSFKGLETYKQEFVTFSSNVSGLNLSEFPDISSICSSTDSPGQFESSFITNCANKEQIFLESSRVLDDDLDDLKERFDSVVLSSEDYSEINDSSNTNLKPLPSYQDILPDVNPSEKELTSTDSSSEENEQETISEHSEQLSTGVLLESYCQKPRGVEEKVLDDEVSSSELDKKTDSLEITTEQSNSLDRIDQLLPDNSTAVLQKDLCTQNREKQENTVEDAEIQHVSNLTQSLHSEKFTTPCKNVDIEEHSETSDTVKQNKEKQENTVEDAEIQHVSKLTQLLHSEKFTTPCKNVDMEEENSETSDTVTFLAGRLSEMACFEEGTVDCGNSETLHVSEVKAVSLDTDEYKISKGEENLKTDSVSEVETVSLDTDEYKILKVEENLKTELQPVTVHPEEYKTESEILTPEVGNHLNTNDEKLEGTDYEDCVEEVVNLEKTNEDQDSDASESVHLESNSSGLQLSSVHDKTYTDTSSPVESCERNENKVNLHCSISATTSEDCYVPLSPDSLNFANSNTDVSGLSEEKSYLSSSPKDVSSDNIDLSKTSKDSTTFHSDSEAYSVDSLEQSGGKDRILMYSFVDQKLQYAKREDLDSSSLEASFDCQGLSEQSDENVYSISSTSDFDLNSSYVVDRTAQDHVLLCCTSDNDLLKAKDASGMGPEDVCIDSESISCQRNQKSEIVISDSECSDSNAVSQSPVSSCTVKKDDPKTKDEVALTKSQQRDLIDLETEKNICKTESDDSETCVVEGTTSLEASFDCQCVSEQSDENTYSISSTSDSDLNSSHVVDRPEQDNVFLCCTSDKDLLKTKNAPGMSPESACLDPKSIPSQTNQKAEIIISDSECSAVTQSPVSFCTVKDDHQTKDGIALTISQHVDEVKHTDSTGLETEKDIHETESADSETCFVEETAIASTSKTENESKSEETEKKQVDSSENVVPHVQENDSLDTVKIPKVQ